MMATLPIRTIFHDRGAVFICYSRSDNQSSNPKERWLDRLLEFLQPLVRQHLLQTWSDQDIKIGDSWHESIRDQLEVSKAVVLLVSPAFLASEYIATSELPILLKTAAEGGAAILPIIVSPCLYEETMFRHPDPKLGPSVLRLSSIQSTNPPSQALNEMTEAEQNRTLLRLARRLVEIAIPPERVEAPQLNLPIGLVRAADDSVGVRPSLEAGSDAGEVEAGGGGSMAGVWNWFAATIPEIQYLFVSESDDLISVLIVVPDMSFSIERKICSAQLEMIDAFPGLKWTFRSVSLRGRSLAEIVTSSKKLTFRRS